MEFKEIEDIIDGRTVDEVLGLYESASQEAASGGVAEGAEAAAAAPAEMRSALSAADAARVGAWLERETSRLKALAELEGSRERRATLLRAHRKLEEARARAMLRSGRKSSARTLPPDSEGAPAAHTLTSPSSQSPSGPKLDSGAARGTGPRARYTEEELKRLPQTPGTWCPLKDTAYFRPLLERTILAQAGKKLIYISKLYITSAAKEWTPETPQQRRRRLHGLSPRMAEISDAIPGLGFQSNQSFHALSFHENYCQENLCPNCIQTLV